MSVKRLFWHNLQLAFLFVAFFAPLFLYANESVDTGRMQASVKNNGNWELTDSATHVTWYGEWIAPRLMKVTGSDNSCFVVGENEIGMVQLDCRDLTQISILLSYQNF
jgi:hypothetical protein